MLETKTSENEVVVDSGVGQGGTMHVYYNDLQTYNSMSKLKLEQWSTGKLIRKTRSIYIYYMLIRVPVCLIHSLLPHIQFIPDLLTDVLNRHARYRPAHGST